MADPTFTTRADLEQWVSRAARDAQAHEALGERGAVIKALAAIKRVTVAHLHTPFPDEITKADTDLAHRIVTEFRPKGWPDKEAELARLLASHRLAAMHPLAGALKQYATGYTDTGAHARAVLESSAR